jgi:hypothetical protein
MVGIYGISCIVAVYVDVELLIYLNIIYNEKDYIFINVNNVCHYLV